MSAAAANDEDAVLDAAIEQYDRATVLRHDGKDAEALELVEGALGLIEQLLSTEAGIIRARFAITRAELATRTTSVDTAIGIANDAVALAMQVRRTEPLLEPSALYMLGKAERPSVAHKFGAASFEKSLERFRKLTGDASEYTQDAANALASAYLKLAEWQRAQTTLELAINQSPDPPTPAQILGRAVASERLGLVEGARADIRKWLATADSRPLDEQLRGHLAASRIAAAHEDAMAAAVELVRAQDVGRELPDPSHQASLLEGAAWVLSTATPPWFLAAEVLMRRAAAMAWSPVISDTAWRIASLWRYGVEEAFVQPQFAVLEVEACLERWDAPTARYVAREGTQQMQLVLAGAPTTMERLADDRWRDLCVQRVFSVFHAEQFKANEPSFVAPVRSVPHQLNAAQALYLLPSLRVPKWATANTVMVSSLGEIEVVSRTDFAILAARAVGQTVEAVDLVLAAIPTLDRDGAHALLTEPPAATLAPASSIPLIPES